MNPWMPPMKAPTPTPISRAMTHRNGKSTPIPIAVSQSVISSA